MLDEFYCIACRKKVYGSVEALQVARDPWLDQCNNQREPQGRRRYGKDPGTRLPRLRACEDMNRARAGVPEGAQSRRKAQLGWGPDEALQRRVGPFWDPGAGTIHIFTGSHSQIERWTMPNPSTSCSRAVRHSRKR